MSKKATKSKPKPKKREAEFLPDGDGGTLAPPSIREIDEAADAYQIAKQKRVDKALELKEKENVAYDALDQAMSKHLDELGAARTYTYTCRNDKRKVIRYGKARISIKTAKAERVKSIPKAKPASNQINPPGEELPVLE